MYFNKELFRVLVLSDFELSPFEISKRIGVSYSNFLLWMNGESEPKTENIKKIAEYFSKDINCFFKIVQV